MMTLEEAVATYEQYVLDAKQEKLSETYKYYSQLAEWLRELQERRKAPEIIRCGECKYREIQGVYGFCDHITGEEIMVRKTDYCSWAERRTDG